MSTHADDHIDDMLNQALEFGEKLFMRRPKHKPVWLDLPGKFVLDTDKAILLLVDGNDDPTWIPKSVCIPNKYDNYRAHGWFEFSLGETVTLRVRRWWLTETNLLERTKSDER